MDYKFTQDGKKVVIVGSLNAKETIVQEVFVTDGTEFPAGEHFVVKTLLDSPAETYKAREERRVLESTQKLEATRDRLSGEIAGFTLKARAAAAKIKWIEGIDEPEVAEVFDNLKAMICGEYTHVFLPGSTEIKEWGHDLFARSDDYNKRFESLRLISLFGNWNGRLGLNWKVNTYQDGSGGSTHIVPCRSLQEAVAAAKEIIYAKEHLSDKDFEFCLKYGILVDESKNAARLAGKADYIKKRIASQKEQLAKLEEDLASIVQH